jgi:hypothetical protein
MRSRFSLIFWITHYVKLWAQYWGLEDEALRKRKANRIQSSFQVTMFGLWNRLQIKIFYLLNYWIFESLVFWAPSIFWLSNPCQMGRSL